MSCSQVVYQWLLLLLSPLLYSPLLWHQQIAQNHCHHKVSPSRCHLTSVHIWLCNEISKTLWVRRCTHAPIALIDISPSHEKNPVWNLVHCIRQSCVAWFLVHSHSTNTCGGSTLDIVGMCSPLQVQAVAVVGDSVSGTSLVIPSAQVDQQGQHVRMDTADVHTIAFGNLVTATVSESL